MSAEIAAQLRRHLAYSTDPAWIEREAQAAEARDRAAILTVALWDRQVHECPKCGKVDRIDHAIGYCCGYTHDEIGKPSTEYRGLEVGGMSVCKACHDEFYGVNASP